jgi:hypothetical protein
MEMLASSETVCRFLLPFEQLEKPEATRVMTGRRTYVVIPESGASLRQLVHSWAVSGPVEEAVARLPRRLIFIDAPDLTLNRRRLVVLRVHMQKCPGGDWTALTGARNLRRPDAQVFLGPPVDEAAYSVATSASMFIPRLGACFIDFTFGGDGKPYVLHLGGWDRHLLDSIQGARKGVDARLVDFWDRDLLAYAGGLHGSLVRTLIAYMGSVERGKQADVG